MKAFEFVTEIDERRLLELALPSSAPLGHARVIVLLPEPEEDEASAAWMQGVAREWAADLADERQDVYTLQDGEPVDESE
jgi:hypothetical protein